MSGPLRHQGARAGSVEIAQLRISALAIANRFPHQVLTTASYAEQIVAWALGDIADSYKPIDGMEVISASAGSRISTASLIKAYRADVFPRTEGDLTMSDAELRLAAINAVLKMSVERPPVDQMLADAAKVYEFLTGDIRAVVAQHVTDGKLCEAAAA